MKDGWYLITRSDGKRFVEYIFRNSTNNMGSVHELNMQGAVFDEVKITVEKNGTEIVNNG